MYTQEELLAFREGVKCGFDLFTHLNKETNEMIRILSSGEILTQEKFHKQVDEGRWDDVLKNFKEKQNDTK